MSTHEWTSATTAEAYYDYTQKYLYYKILGKKLIQTARELPTFNEDITILDLACGTGLITELLLEEPNGTFNIIAIDKSPDMLTKARSVIGGDKNVRFIESPAEEIDQKLELNSVDLIFCNSAFWKFEVDKTLHAIDRVLKPQGIFVFNIVENYLKEGAVSQSPNSFNQLMISSAAEMGIQSPQPKTRRIFTGENSLDNLIEDTHLEIFRSSSFQIMRTASEVSDLFLISGTISIYFPNQDQPTRMKIHRRALRKFDQTKKYPENWVYVVMQKNPLKKIQTSS